MVENVNIVVKTAAEIVDLQVESSEPFEKKQDSCQLQLRIPSLNPGETVRILGQCVKMQGLTNYINEMSVTHSEGVGIDRKSLHVSEIEFEVPLPFSFWRPRVAYSFEKRRFQIR